MAAGGCVIGGKKNLAFMVVADGFLVVVVLYAEFLGHLWWLVGVQG